MADFSFFECYSTTCLYLANSPMIVPSCRFAPIAELSMFIAAETFFPVCLWASDYCQIDFEGACDVDSYW